MSGHLGAQCNLSFFDASSSFPGFAPHYDVFHSVLVQLRGSKAWQLHPAPVADPMMQHEWPQIEHLYPDGALQEEAPSDEVVLHAGDVLWIPTGWVHAGMSSEVGSTHGTLGVRPPRVQELLSYIIASASSVPTLRKECEPLKNEDVGAGREAVDDAIGRLREAVVALGDERLASAVDSWRRNFWRVGSE